MVKTRAWKRFRVFTENSLWRLCKEHRVTVQHRCKMLARSEYLQDINRALMVMAVALIKGTESIRSERDMISKKWNRGHVLRNSKTKLVWDFEFNLRKTTTSWRPDLMLEEKQRKTNHIDMRYGMPERDQYIKEEIWEKNQLQVACIWEKREKTWIQS